MRHLRMLHLTIFKTGPTCLIAATLFAISLAVHSDKAFGTDGITKGAVTKNTLTEADCLREIDTLVLHVDQVDIDTAQNRLTTLADSCEGVPQIQHNVGVAAAKRGEWENAIRAFERAIALNPQTADTVNQLTAVHEYQARKAWNAALALDKRPSEPEFTWQTSSDENRQVSARADGVTGLRSVATLDFELYNWWQARSNDDNAAWADFYVNGYPAPTFAQPTSLDWDSVRKDIQFTATDAAVVLSWDLEGDAHHRWLLLTLAGQRWQIYHESEF